MKVTPIYDRVLIKRIEQEVKTSAGLFIPEQAKERPSFGVVVAVGTGRVQADGSLLPLCVKEGEKVFFGKYAGTEMRTDKETLLMVREEDILGIIHEE